MSFGEHIVSRRSLPLRSSAARALAAVVSLWPGVRRADLATAGTRLPLERQHCAALASGCS